MVQSDLGAANKSWPPLTASRPGPLMITVVVVVVLLLLIIIVTVVIVTIIMIIIHATLTANLRTKILDLRGFDSSIILT